MGYPYPSFCSCPFFGGPTINDSPTGSGSGLRVSTSGSFEGFCDTV